MPRRPALVLVAALALAAAALAPAQARAAIAPPWCGTPMPDAAEGLPDGTQPTHPVGSFPHIPWYAIGCTLDRIRSESPDGRMSVEVIGRSALGREQYGVVINALATEQQRKSFHAWEQIRKVALTDPERAQALLADAGEDVKVPIYVQGGIHGNEYEGVDAAMRLVERLGTTPYGADPEVDAVLDRAIVIVNPVQNPDGRIAGARANGNGFDLNRDFLTQSQSETLSSVGIMQRWIPSEMLDLHGYVTPTLIEATTKPHNPSIEYDLWLKWNQSRIDANEAAMNAIGLAVTRPINDWCPEGDEPNVPGGLCDDGSTPGPAVAEGWDDWGPFYTPMYAQHIGLNGSTVEMCNSTGTGCGVPGSTTHQRGRLGALLAQETVVWSTLAFDVENRRELLHDQLEIYRRGVLNAARPPCCPPPFDVANNWMTEYPTAHVIPLGAGQRSNPEANRLVAWLLANGVEVEELKQDLVWDGRTFERGSYVVFMDQARRGLANTALAVGDDVSGSISQLYAPPAAWSHGYLWGADLVTIPRGAAFAPQTNRILAPSHLPGGVEPGTTQAYALELDSPTAVRTLNALLRRGLEARVALAPSTAPGGGVLPAGSVFFAADPATKNALDAAGKEAGLTFRRATAPSATEPIERVPRIAVLTGAVNQDVWSLRNLGFDADPVSTTTLNTALEDPLLAYDLVFSTAGWPSAALPVARERLTAFFAGGGGYLGAGVNGAAFLANGGQVLGLTAASRGGSGRSGIVNWENVGGSGSPIVGAYPEADTAIADPPAWFTSIPGTFTADARYPDTGILAAGLWLLDPQSASAPGATIIAHGTNTAGSSRQTVFALNPLYRADPEREWPALAAAAYWADR
ncbi:MAG TPA: M14 family zinc carboxypeptidase [Gaiellaceae bacterium]|nr:M14 family zinc carboxypeptidase [Gaiellaceae bacterium]